MCFHVGVFSSVLSLRLCVGVCLFPDGLYCIYFVIFLNVCVYIYIYLSFIGQRHLEVDRKCRGRERGRHAKMA